MPLVKLTLQGEDAPEDRELELARVPVVGDLIQIEDVEKYYGFFKVVTVTFYIRGEDADAPRIVAEYYGP